MWLGTPGATVAVFVVALLVFALQSFALPAFPGRDMVRYVQAYVQYFYSEPVLPSVLSTRGPLAALGVSLPLELGGVAAEVWLALLYAASIVAWWHVALTFGPRTALATGLLLLLYPGYGILFHGLASDALFAAGFAGWALLLRRSILRPSVASFLTLGAWTGSLVLIRPANQVLFVAALLPAALQGPWRQRVAWAAAFLAPAVLVVQSWYALSLLRHGDPAGLRPSAPALFIALALSMLLLPAAWPRRLGLVALSLLAAAVVIRGAAGDAGWLARSASHAPAVEVFLFRAFQIDRIVSPDNGPASKEMGQVVERELLANEPYRSYGIDLDEFFSSGSDRVFSDLQNLAGQVDLRSVTVEAIRSHPWTFAKGISSTIAQLLWSRRVYAQITVSSQHAPSDRDVRDEGGSVFVDGVRLPTPGEGQPIPGSRFGPRIWTLWGGAREVWLSAVDRSLVFDDPRDEERYRRFQRDSGRLVDRLPTRHAREGLVHRMNQASRAFPPPGIWLGLGLIGVAVRRPERALVALAPAAAGAVLLLAVGMVATATPEYAAPVSPAFVLLAAAGMLGDGPGGFFRGGRTQPRIVTRLLRR